MLGQITAPKKLCLLRLSAIGDVCHAVAMVQQIQAHYPETEITWVIGKIEASLLQGMSGVKFVIFDKKAGLQGYKDLRNALKHEKFDVLLHMQVALRASLASLCIRANIKVGFDRFRAKEGQWLFTNKKIAPQQSPHVLDGFLGFAKAIGVSVSEPTWRIPLSAEDETWAVNELPKNKPIAIIAPSASKAERNWHYEGYAHIANTLIEKGFEVVLCGGPTTSEKLLAEQIIATCKSALHNLVGKTSLKQLLAVLKQGHLVIAPDTGPAHMAVTVNTPVIGLYAHSNPLRTGPYNYQHYVVNVYDNAIQEQEKKVLAQIPWGVRAKGKDLMNAITVAQVQDKITQVIADHYPDMQ